jgi:hypothetical protein
LEGRTAAAVRDCYRDRHKANTAQLIKHALLGFTFCLSTEIQRVATCNKTIAETFRFCKLMMAVVYYAFSCQLESSEILIRLSLISKFAILLLEAYQLLMPSAKMLLCARKI